jgi:hypothetical protein
MIPWLLAILSIIALASTSRVNMWALTLFTIPSLLFYVVADYIQESHYIFAALIDLFIIYSLSRIDEPTKLVAYLAIASLASMFINLIGWIIYMMYLEPVFYEMAGVLLYAVVIVLALWDKVNGHPSNNRKNSSVHGVYTFGHKFYFKNTR